MNLYKNVLYFYGKKQRKKEAYLRRYNDNHKSRLFKSILLQIKITVL